MPDLICPACDRDEWLAARRAGVTATDIVTILGLSSRDSIYSLYWRKMGHIPDTPDNDRMRLGRELEPYVLGRWLDAAGDEDEFSRSGELWQSDARPWQLATLDAIYRARPVEVKTWADAARDMWLDGPPPAVRAQVLWQMDVMDVATGHVGVLFLPSGEFRSYVIEHHGGKHLGGPLRCQACDDLDLMRAAGEEFMARLRMELPPPDPDNSAATLAAVRARFAKAKGKRGQVDAKTWEAWTASKQIVADQELFVRKYEIRLREQLGEADEIEVDGELVGRRVVAVQHVKAHDRRMDYLKRAGNGKTGSDE